jgi:exopolyphosphatase/guanosine-5'-triphosphate,3'-diphosphate pyrophosphatase
VLSGDEEGTLTYLGAVSEFRKPGAKQKFAVLDIGGGSTELSTGTNVQVVQRTSLDIGSVRLTERILKISPPEQVALDEAEKYIETHVKRFEQLSPNARLIGVAGTLTTLAALDLGLQQYDRTAVSGHTLNIDSIRRIFNDLRMKSLDELKRYPQILPERADILVGGILILLKTLTALQRREIIASDRGLRYGMAAEAASMKP